MSNVRGPQQGDDQGEDGQLVARAPLMLGAITLFDFSSQYA